MSSTAHSRHSPQSFLDAPGLAHDLDLVLPRPQDLVIVDDEDSGPHGLRVRVSYEEEP
jgi:hypothetical protein